MECCRAFVHYLYIDADARLSFFTNTHVSKLLEIHFRKKLKSSGKGESLFSKGEELIGAMKAGDGFDKLYSADGAGKIAKLHEHGHDHEHDLLKDDVMLIKGKQNISKLASKIASMTRGSSATGDSSATGGSSASEFEMRSHGDSDSELREAQEAYRNRRASSIGIQVKDNEIKEKLEHLAHKVERIYKKALDLIMLFNCFYVAVFFANYSVITLEEENLPWLWFAASLLPGFIILVFCGKAVKTQGIIGAICSINLEVVEKVINETEEIFHTGKEVFTDFKAKLEFLHLTMADLEREFDRIDKDGSGDLR